MQCGGGDSRLGIQSVGIQPQIERHAGAAYSPVRHTGARDRRAEIAVRILFVLCVG